MVKGIAIVKGTLYVTDKEGNKRLVSDDAKFDLEYDFPSKLEAEVDFSGLEKRIIDMSALTSTTFTMSFAGSGGGVYESVIRMSEEVEREHRRMEIFLGPVWAEQMQIAMSTIAFSHRTKSYLDLIKETNQYLIDKA